MPRIRTIKPEFWVDDKVVELDPWARLLFIGLWNFADDQGFIEYSPRRIKMQIFPGDSLEVSVLLASLLESGLLAAYESPFGKVLHIQSWDRHQKVSNPAAPRFDMSELVPFHLSDDTPLEGSRGVQIPLSGKERKGKEEERKGKETYSSSATDSQQTLIDVAPDASSTRASPRDFDRFWEIYPRRESKGAAKRAWAGAIKKAPVEVILSGAQSYRDDGARLRAEMKFTKLPATWLNAECWTDERPAANGRASPNGHQSYRNPEDPSIYEGDL